MALCGEGESAALPRMSSRVWPWWRKVSRMKVEKARREKILEAVLRWTRQGSPLVLKILEKGKDGRGREEIDVNTKKRKREKGNMNVPFTKEIMKDKGELASLVIVGKVVLQDVLDIFGRGQDEVLPELPRLPVLFGVLQEVLVHPASVIHRDVKEDLERWLVA